MKIIKVVAAIIQHEGKVYATQRGYGEFKGGWEFPGGKIETGETPEEALKREIMEELETEISIDQYAGIVEYDYPEFLLSMACYFCHVTSGRLMLVEHMVAKCLQNGEKLVVLMMLTGFRRIGLWLDGLDRIY